MEKKEYLVGVTIIEARNLKGLDSAGTSDPYVKIRCANVEQPQVTQTKYKANTTVWNQSFTFPNILMNQYELETYDLILEVYDHNTVMNDELIGKYSIGLSTLYRNLNHEFYRQWLTLFNPSLPNEIQGYLQISCFIVGQNERPPAHGQDEDYYDDEESIDEDAMAGLSEEQKLQNMKKKQGLFMLLNPSIIRKGYQLSVNILKAEGLPQCDSSGRCNSYISVRCIGEPLSSRVIEENYNPMYNTRLCYPIRLPILNDKIVVRVWHRVNFPSKDSFIANIPEYPSQFDYFNISKLLSNDGKMRPTWFNLYGLHPLERGWFESNNAKKKEGSFYLGRVLISMQLSPNEKPQLLTTVAQPAKEPTSQKFQLWVDTYDLVNCDEARGRDLWVVATIGSYQSVKHYGKYKEATESYTWKKVSIKTLQVDYPQDLKQTPDIIINVYSKSRFIGQESRLGYIRIPARDCRRKHPQPQWYRLKSPLNDKTCPGIILMNVQYMWEGADIERFPKQRSVEGSFRLFAQILSGYDLAPTYSEDSLNTKIDIKIGNIAVLKEGIMTDAITGKFPQWNTLKVKDIVIDKHLQFASDMRVILYNCTKSMIFRRDQEDIIGEFCVPITSISKKLYSKPQFFNVISHDGDFQGQILARFFLKEIDLKKKKDDSSGLIEEFNQITRVAFKVNIIISLVGIRNLIYFAKKPVVTFKLTNDPKKREQTIRFDEKIFDSQNPNFGNILVFKDVELPFEPLLWPQLIIFIRDEGNMFKLRGCEQCYTIIPIFEYADFLREEDIKFALSQLNKNQNKISLVQKQINPVKYYKKQQRDSLSNIKSYHDDVEFTNERNDSDNDDLNSTGYGMNMVGGMLIKEFEQSQDLENQLYFNHTSDEDDDDDDDEDNDRRNNRQVNAKDIKIEMKKRQSRNKISDNDIRDKLQQDSSEDLINVNHRKNGRSSKLKDFNLQDGRLNVDNDNIIEIACTPQMKLEEERLRQAQIQELERKCDKLSLQIQRTQNGMKKEKLKNEVMEIKNKIQQLNDEKMTEQKFWGYIMDDQQEEFQLGREVIREGTYEKYLKCPYRQYPLFTTNQTGKTAQVGGLLRSGQLTGAMLKACIKVKSVDDDGDSSNGSDSEQQDQEKQQPQNNGYKKKNRRTPGQEMEFDDTYKKDRESKPKDEEDKETALLKKISENYPFDLTKERFLRQVINQRQHFKVRVYLLNCQNLSALDSHIGIKDRLAGNQALCSADPFPVIIVGDGRNDTVDQKVKYVNERDKEISQNLNPIFNRSYEFDASFPEDWKVEIQIYDKGKLSLTDALIGSTVIDLEDRYYGNLRKQISDSLDLYKEIAQKEILMEDRKEVPNKKYIMERKKKIDEIIKEQSTLKAIEQKPTAIELRELRHPNKKQAQGMVEMWVEVLTQEEARRLPMARLQQQVKEEYELRLIIWEARDFPLQNGSSVDLYFKVSFDPTGWSGNEIEKQTDVHYGSKDGTGIFNYRFKFNIDLPCDFPRLKFQAYDYGYTGDSSLGEAILNLKKTIGLLQKEGKIEIPKTWLQCKNPTAQVEQGQILISIQILSKAEAEGAPVGEAQNEPNENPKLEQPSEGRGIVHKIISVANVDVSKFRIPKFNMFRNFIILGVIVAVVVIVLILIMFLR